MSPSSPSFFFFFFNDTATTEIYTLSLHDALPIFIRIDHNRVGFRVFRDGLQMRLRNAGRTEDQPARHPVKFYQSKSSRQLIMSGEKNRFASEFPNFAIEDRTVQDLIQRDKIGRAHV